jgi:hypothetical protein
MSLNRRLPSVDPGRIAMVPRSDVPRSTYKTRHSLKSTFQSGYLIPILVKEVLPGDSHVGQITIFARLATLLFPIMDNVELETFFFFVPNRLVWDNWVRMMGERSNPADSISYTVPQIISPSGGFAVASVWDYMGIPPSGQILAGRTISINALPNRAYNLIYNEWFRDENLINSAPVAKDAGPDPLTNYSLFTRAKKKDYFTSALPWPLKGGVEVTMPLSGTAPVKGIGWNNATAHTLTSPTIIETGGTTSVYAAYSETSTVPIYMKAASNSAGAAGQPQVFADLSTATGATINALRMAVQTQRFLEKDARGGTRYTELLQSHFGVTPEDYRLQRPEYIGGGKTNITTNAIPQTSATGATGTTSALGALSAQATVSGQHHFSTHAMEHGYIIGIANVRADITYQQGLHRMWTRSTRYDFYWPVFAHLGEQGIRNDEIFVQGLAADTAIFGYQERWGEYRYEPSRITGLFRSTSAGSIDPWHLAQNFVSLPALNSTFIEESVPLARALAAGVAANNMQVLFDSVYEIKSTRPMPTYSVPGMMDHF